MNKRLEMLQSLTRDGGGDAFAWYGLAMEYRREARPDDAMDAFRTLRRMHPDYLPMYLMAGQVLLADDKQGEAREWLEAGVALAETKGDEKTLGELREALSECDSPASDS